VHNFIKVLQLVHISLFPWSTSLPALGHMQPEISALIFFSEIILRSR